MPESYTISAGDGTTSIAGARGYFPDTIWNDPANKALKELRDDMDILLPGDVLVIPDKNQRDEECALDTRHVFKRKGIPARFRLQVLVQGNPAAGREFLLAIEGSAQLRGVTNGEGFVEQYLPANCQKAVLMVNWSDTERPLVYKLNFGQLDPITDLRGVQERLNNLGFDCGTADGTLTGQTADALRAFQSLNGIPVTGEADDATRAHLKSIHDRP